MFAQYFDFAFTPGNRPPNWRLELGKLLVYDEVPPVARRRVDQTVRRAARVCTGHPDPDIHAAIDLQFNGPVIDRAEITARILAKQTARHIAAAVDLPKAVVELFERLAFDVRRQQPLPAGIRGLNVLEAIDRDDVEAVLNRIAVQHGLEALETVLPYYRSGQYLLPVAEPDPAEEQDGPTKWDKYRMLIDLLIAPVDLLAMVIEMRREAAAGGPLPWDEPPPSDATT
jgi:hypothetical protein